MSIPASRAAVLVAVAVILAAAASIASGLAPPLDAEPPAAAAENR